MNCESPILSSRQPASTPPQNYQTTPAGSPSTSVDRDSCFLCRQKGHWKKDCPLKSSSKQSKPSAPTNGGSGSSNGGRDFPEMVCPCGEGPCIVYTSQTEKNPGRQFYCCPGDGCMNCDFFQWCDEGSSNEWSNNPISPYPKCPCGAGKCRLVGVRRGEHAGKKAFVCHIRRGQGACDFFQLQDCPVKEDEMVDCQSDESIPLGNPQSLSKDDKDTEAAANGKQGEYSTKPESVMHAALNAKGLPSTSCSEKVGFVEEMGHHQLPVWKPSLDREKEEYNGNEPHIFNLPQKGFHIKEADCCLPLDKLDLNEEGEEGDDSWMDGLLFFGFINEGERDDNEPELEGLFFYGSIEEEFTSPSGKEFHLKVANPPKRLEKGLVRGQEDEILCWSVKKRRVSSSSEQFEVETVQQPSAIRRLDFDDEWVGGDHNGLVNSPLNVPNDKGKAVSSVEGFQAEVGQHSNIRMPDLQELGDNEDMVVERVSFGTCKGKEQVSTSAEGLQVERAGHHPDIEMLDLDKGQQQDNDKGSETASFNFSSRNDPVSSGERFQAKEDSHNPEVEMVDSDFEWGEEDDKALEDLVLSVCTKKGLVSLFGEVFQEKVGHNPSTEELNLHEEGDAQGPPSASGSGSDVEWIDVNEGGEGDDRAKDLGKKAMVSSSIDGFKLDEVRQRHPIEGFNLLELRDDENRLYLQPPSAVKGSQLELGCHRSCIGVTSHGKGIAVVNANGLDKMPLHLSNEKRLPPLHGKGCEEGKIAHDKCIEEGLGSKEGNVSSMSLQARKCFQPVKAGNMMKQFSSSQICFRCGKSGHSKKDCNS